MLAESASNVKTDFQFLPYQVYGGSIYPDYMSKAFTGENTIAEQMGRVIRP